MNIFLRFTLHALRFTNDGFYMFKTTIGIDIGTKNLKVVCLETGINGYKLTAFGFLSCDEKKEQIAKFIKEAGIKTKDVRINIENPSLRIRRLDLPQMPDAELNEAVKWGCRKFVAGSVEDYEFRYTRINTEDLKLSDKIPLIVFAIKRDAIKACVDFTKEIGLAYPKIIEPNASAIASIFDNCSGVSREDYNIIIDIGSFHALFVVMGKRGFLFSRPLAGSADSNLIAQIARDIGTDSEKAGEIKDSYFGVGGAVKHELSEQQNSVLKNTISHFYSRFALEVQRSLDGFTQMFGKKNISEISLCGGGAYYTELKEFLNKNLNVPVEIFNPFKKINVKSSDMEMLKNSKALFAVACGLAVD
ncbi:MAG: pilus assembly protein PilM [Pseudomonadota bacterium]